MKKIENITQDELQIIEEIVGEAFITNKMFNCFGDIHQRRNDVMNYMKYFVDYVYETHCLYSNDEGTGFIGIEDSRKVKLFPELKFLYRVFKNGNYLKLRELLMFSNEISQGNSKYSKKSHLDILFLCVKKEEQGKGKASELVRFAQNMSKELQIPVLFDTDMEDYASIYQHLGCTLYNSITTSSNIIRYNLVYNEKGKQK